MSDPVATALTLTSLRAQRDEMKAVIEQASAALALAGIGGGLLAQVGAVLAKVERLEARRAKPCTQCDASGLRCTCGAYNPILTKSGRGWRWSCCGRTTKTDDARGCDRCGGNGAVIVDLTGEVRP